MFRLTFSALLIVSLLGCGLYPPNESGVTMKSPSVDSLPPSGEFVAVEVPPEMIKSVEPDYPALARQAGLEGNVWVKALVDRNGDVKDARVQKSSGTPSLDEAAIQAAKQCKYKPGISHGQPVACWVTYRVDFKLP